MMRRTFGAVGAGVLGLALATVVSGAPQAPATATKAKTPARPAAAAIQPGLAEADVNAALQAAYAKYKDLKEGKNADYIPALAKVDSNIYGIALVTTDGKVYTAGDIKSEEAWSACPEGRGRSVERARRPDAAGEASSPDR